MIRASKSQDDSKPDEEAPISVFPLIPGDTPASTTVSNEESFNRILKFRQGTFDSKLDLQKHRKVGVSPILCIPSEECLCKVAIRIGLREQVMTGWTLAGTVL